MKATIKMSDLKNWLSDFLKRDLHVCQALLTILLLIGGIKSQGQVISLDSVLQLIDQRNPMLQEYDNKVKAMNEYAEGAKSWMAPMIGAGTFMTPYPGQRLMEERDKGSWMFSIEQQIPNPVKQNANKVYMQSKAGIEKESRAVQFNKLRYEAMLNYYELIVAHRRLSVLQDGEKIIQLMIKLARIRYPYNQGNLGNIYLAEGRLSELQNMMLMNKTDIQERDSRLKALARIPFSDSIMVDTATTVSVNVNQLITDTVSLSQRSDIRQIDKTIESMRLNQQFQKYQAKPDFKIRFDHMQPIGNMPSQFTAMAMMSVPIVPWASKMYKSEIRGMEYDIEAMKKQREAILVEGRGMLMGMNSQLLGVTKQLNNYRTRIIPSLQRNYQTLMVAYEENKEQLPMVIDAWEALNMAQLEYFNKMNDYYKMIVIYEKEAER